MISLKELNIEYIFGVLFGVIGLVLSFLIGLFAGNAIGTVFFRSIIFTITFCIIGYVNLIIVKKYVPEIYEALNIMKSSKENENIDFPSGSEDKGMTDEFLQEVDASSQDAETLIADDEALSLKEPTVTPTETFLDLGGKGESAQADMNDKNIRYEPKIMAQAIRTMMKRDDE
ncbi:MAG: hypothetical protein SVZ03_08460 [Spirochaetota bacterium]|nr:hypothetical protein [Spirochaetota bacterium]